jgi:transketolase
MDTSTTNSLLSITKLESMSRSVRRLVLDTTHRAGMGHTGGSLSEADILTALYFRVMRAIDPKVPGKTDRDRFILSKGHATPGFYAALASRGYFSPKTLETFDELGTTLQAHPDMRKTPGVDMSSGSLGQGLSVGIGMAIAAGCKPELGGFRTFVLMGDGELQEGQVWEAAMYAGSRAQAGVIAIVDCNGVQLSTATDGAVGPESLAGKWKSFGWHAMVVDGHDMGALVEVLEKARELSGSGPVAVIAKTVKGKGVSFMEGRYEWHGKAPNDAEYEQALKEIGS